MPTRQRIQDRTELVRNTLIQLSDTEIKLYTEIGQARYNSNRKKSVKDTAAKRDKSDPYKFDILGVAGELALYKMTKANRSITSRHLLLTASSLPFT